VLVLPPVRGPVQHAAAGQPGGREVLDAGRLVRGRRGARRAPPALRTVLAQGSVRRGRRLHEGTLPEARLPGHDPRRAGVQRARRREGQHCPRGHPERGRKEAERGRGGGKVRRRKRVRIRPQVGPVGARHRPGPQDEQEPRQRGQPGRRRLRLRRRLPPSLRDVHGTAAGDESVELQGRRGRPPLPGQGLPAHRRPERRHGVDAIVDLSHRRRPHQGAAQAPPRLHQEGLRGDGGDALQHGHRGHDGVCQRRLQVGLVPEGRPQGGYFIRLPTFPPPHAAPLLTRALLVPCP